MTSYVLEVEALELPCDIEIKTEDRVCTGQKGDVLVVYPEGRIEIVSQGEFRKTFRPKYDPSLRDLLETIDDLLPNVRKQPYRITWGTESWPKGLLP